MRWAGFWFWRAGVATLCALGVSVAGLTACAAEQHPAAGATGVTYYVSPSGSDTNSGTDPSHPWQTLGKVTSTVVHPGDRVLLRGGATFTGTLSFTHEDAGNASKPVHVGSYGTGRATISAPDGSAILIYNTAGISMANLVIKGTASPPGKPGINLYTDLPGNPKLAHVAISHVDVSGFADGIAIGGGNGTAGFSGVSISNSALHGNLDNGLISYGPAFTPASPNYANAHIRISHVAAYANRGDPQNTKTDTGSGIVLGSVRGATVAWSTAHGNGGRDAGPSGPVGIWAYNSTGVVFKHDLAYRNHTGGRNDGGGFDFDVNTSHSAMEYNLSYGNAGPGFLVYTHNANSLDKGNVIRFNISSGDSLKNVRYGGIQVAGRVIGAAIYQNTVVMGRRASSAYAIPLVLGNGLRRTTIRNNIFLTYQPGPVVTSKGPLRRSAVLLQGNDYFSGAHQWSAVWGSAVYDSLTAFRSGTGQERLSGRATGFAVPPRMAGPVLRLHVRKAGGGGKGFLLRPRSRLLRKGLDLLLFGIHPGRIDYSGHRISVRTPNVGAQ